MSLGLFSESRFVLLPPVFARIVVFAVSGYELCLFKTAVGLGETDGNRMS